MHEYQPGSGIFTVDALYYQPELASIHLIRSGDRVAIVDTGTQFSLPQVESGLQQLGLKFEHVDYIILTHIHLDHAGGAGLLMQQLPNARCVIHPRGAAHMIDPAKIIAGTEAVYGIEQSRLMYGEIQPIDAERCVVAEEDMWFDLNGRKLQTIHTEGHALHHYCLIDPGAKGAFTGDSFGVSYRELDTAAGEFIFASSTPTQFDPDAAHKSVDRIMACEPESVFVTHYSRVTDLARLADDLHACLNFYEEMAMSVIEQIAPYKFIEKSMRDFLITRLREHGFTGDDETISAVLDMDIKLAAKGLVSWLQRLKRAR